MEIVEVADSAQLSAMRAEWNELFEESDSATIYQSWEWNEAWWNAYEKGKRLRLLLVRDGSSLVGIAPSNHGTTLDGLTALVAAFGAAGLVNGALNALCTACVQQEVGSAFLANLNAGGDTVAGVSYTVIESRNDEVVTPQESAFLSGPGVTNITLQNQCVLDQSDHLEIAADPVALADVLNALDPAHPVHVPCLVVLPITGPVGPVPSF